LLTANIRDFATTIPSGLTQTQEHDRIWEPYFDRHNFFERLSAIKERLSSVIGEWNVKSPVEWAPVTRENLRTIANTLEREALLVAEDVPA
jgi:hypothetical protein